MAEDATVKEGEPVDPVAASFLGIVGILEALTKVQPGIAGPSAAAVLDGIRQHWTTPAEPEPPVE
jgi:hypothetical protein